MNFIYYIIVFLCMAVSKRRHSRRGRRGSRKSRVIKKAIRKENNRMFKQKVLGIVK